MTGSAVAAGAAWVPLTLTASTAEAGTCRKYFCYPPFPTAAESDGVYAALINPTAAAVIGSLPLNVHYGERDNGRVQDAYTGKWYWDCHRCGTGFNLGHRNPKVIGALQEALKLIDAGNFLMLSGYRGKLAQKLVASTNDDLPGVTFGVTGAEANEIAVHAARHHTQRQKLVAIADVGLHGGTDLCYSISGSAADQRSRYVIDASNTTFVPYNDAAAMASAITTDTAAVVMEISPAQGGFPVPNPGYLEAVKDACMANGALLIFDEVQTGLGPFGTVWGYQHQGVVPDILTMAKGLGGGVYPISATLMSEAVWSSFVAGNLVPHDTTYGGAELGCVVASTVLDLTTDPGFLARVRCLADRFARGFAGAPFPLNQIGLCMGIGTGNQDPIAVASALAAAGVFAVPSLNAPVVVFRPILTISDKDADDIIQRVRGVLG